MTKKAWNIDTEQYREIKFLRMNFINNYNFTMGHVDITDQLKGSYRIDLWVTNRKWRWSMVFWGIGVLLTNAYVLYKKVLLAEDICPKDLLSHYKFRNEVCLYWINLELNERYYARLSSPPSSATTTCTTAGKSSRRPKRKLEFSPEYTVSLLTSWLSPTTITATTINDASLGFDGKFSCRLDKIRDHHVELASSNSRCGLHWWCAPADKKMRWKQNLSYCPTCNVTMCLECNRLFHTEKNIVERKMEIEKKLRGSYNKDRDSRNLNDKNNNIKRNLHRKM